MDMQMYRWPGFELQLVGELQRQQNSALFCDTLLQTEGISVPTHSCILAALSPYLSQKLSATPSPPAGQKRMLRLQAVKPRTLLKLVGLLYTGELQVRGHKEQDDVLASAHHFGFPELVRGHRDWRRRDELPEMRWSSGRSVKDAQVQVELTERRDRHSPVGKKSCVSKGTQTDNDEETMEYRISHSTPKVSTFLDVSAAPQPQSLLFMNDSSSTDRSESTALSHCLMRPFCDVPNSVILEQSLQSECSEKTGPETGYDSVSEAGNSKRSEGAGMKSTATVKLMDTAHISVKVKLRRRTQGEMWEVVGLQTQDKKLSAHPSMKQDRSRNTSPQKEVPIAAHQKPSETSSLQPEQSEQLDSDSQSLSDRRPGSDSVLLPQHQASPEESDEQLQKLLDDIMMGLNILPGLEGSCRKAVDTTDTGFHDGFESQNMPSCNSLSNAQPLEQVKARDSASCQSTSASKPQTSHYAEEQDLVVAKDFCSSGQKGGCPASEQPSQQGILDLLPLSSGGESEEAFSFPDMQGLPLLPCVSPMPPCTPPPKQPESDTWPQLRRRPWLKEKPHLLQFPLSTMTKAQDECATHSRASKRHPTNREAPAQSCSANHVEDGQLAAAVKLHPKTTEKPSVSEQSGTKRNDSAPRRRTRACRSDPQYQYANGCVLACKQSNVSDGTKSVCLVDLSSNNVLARKTGSSPNVPRKPFEKAEEGLTKTPGPAAQTTARSRIRTRGFVRRSQEMANDTVTEKPASPPICRKNLVNKQDPSLPKRRRGRPCKATPEVNSSDGNPSVRKTESAEETPDDSLKEKPHADETRQECKTRKRKMCPVEEIPSKRTPKSESTDEVGLDKEGRGDPGTNKQSRMISLVEFQKIIKQRHAKRRISKKRMETGNPVEEGGSAAESDRDKMVGPVKEADESSRKQWDDANSSSQETAVDNEDRSQSSSSVCGNELRREEAERKDSTVEAEEEMPPGNGGSDTVSAAVDRRSQLPDDDEEASPSRILPPEAEVIQTTSSTIQEGDKDVEVDVLLCSPDKPHIRECEDLHLSMDVIPDEEEDEETGEIDVTGD